MRNKTKKKYQSKVKRKKNWYIPFFTIIIIGVLGFQLISLYMKLSDYRAIKADLEKQYKDAQVTEQELVDYEAYTQSDEYIQNTARSKLGMVKENEIVFREK